MQAFHSDAHTLQLPAQHRFPLAKYRLLRERIEADPGAVWLCPAPAASAGELALAHEPDYIARVLEGRLDEAEQREIGFPWSPAMPVRSRHSVGATIAAARGALAEGVAMNLAGGTHHAYAHKGSGYCVFNDVAVAARLMQAEWRARQCSGQPGLRVLVIDLDVHQGNGTAAIFRGDPGVFTLSLHGARNFPFRKEAGSLDVELPDGTGDADYLAALEAALDEVDRRTRAQPPGLAFYLAGADPHEGDRLGRLKLTSAGLLARDERVLDWLWERRIPAALCMAGGYGADLAAMVELQYATVQAASRAWQRWQAANGTMAR